MGYIWFVILSSTILGMGIWLGHWIFKNTRNEGFGVFVCIVSGLALIVNIIGLSVNYEDLYDNFQNPLCLEYRGKAPIIYIWNQETYGVYIDEQPYLLEDHLRDYENSVQLIIQSWTHDSIPRIDSLSVYEYQYKPVLGFVKPLGHRYLLVLHQDQYVKYGNCKQMINQLKAD